MPEQENKDKGAFFSQERVKQGMSLGVYYVIFQEKGGFIKNYSNSLLFCGEGGQIGKITQYPCLGSDFCIMTKTCLGVLFQNNWSLMCTLTYLSAPSPGERALQIQLPHLALFGNGSNKEISSDIVNVGY